MKLISCHIQNFGKFHDADINFDEGCHVICEQNGWGKSTLAAFITVMFFGFKSEKRSDDALSERKRYTPWQGGTFGGELVFETDGKRYILERTFGARERDDKISVRDAETNLMSIRFSDRIGEELFQIDRGSFERTVLISQQDCETGTTENINVKIGLLTDNTDDVNNYDTALARLHAALEQMSPTKKTGSLYNMNLEMKNLTQKVSGAADVENTALSYTQEYRKNDDWQKDLKTEHEALQKEYSQLVYYRDIKNKQERYRSLCVDYAKRKQDLDTAAAYFPGEAPTDEVLAERMNEGVELSGLERSLEDMALSMEEVGFLQQWERLLTLNPADDEKVKDLREQVRSYRMVQDAFRRNAMTDEEKKQLAEYRELFAAGTPTEEEFDEQIAKWNRIQVLQSERPGLEQKQKDALRAEQDREAAENRKKARGRGKGLLILGLILVAGGGAAGYFALHSLPMTIALAAVGAVIAVAGAVMMASNKELSAVEQEAIEIPESGTPLSEQLQAEITASREEEEKLSGEMDAFLLPFKSRLTGVVPGILFDVKNSAKEYHRLVEAETRANEEECLADIAAREKAITEALSPYYPSVSPENFEDTVGDLKNDISQYRQLSDRRQKCETGKQQAAVMLQEIRDFIESTGLAVQVNYNMQLRDIQLHYNTLTACRREFDNCQSEKTSFEGTQDIQMLMSVVVPGNLKQPETVEAQISENEQKTETARTNMEFYSRSLEVLYRQKDELEQAQFRLETLKDELAAAQKKYEMLTRTKELLEQAKATFSERYIEPVKKGFDKYYAILSGENPAFCHVDADSHITIEREGLQRDQECFSTGYRDMFGICIRMALVDAMYKNEKPFVIFDDPFVNLDEGKLEGALLFLKEVSKSYQVIYFTCHESRIDLLHSKKED